MTRAGYEHLTAYRHEGGQAECDLSDNTNLFGSAPSALASLAAWAGGDPARYPTPGNEALRGALASWLGVGPNQIVGGCGSNDILDSAMRALGTLGSVLAYSTPTFVMTPHFARANSLDPLPVPSRPDGQPDVEALLATRAPLIYVASPNNPSGVAAAIGRIRLLVDRAPGIVILDEAYTEYLGRSWALEAVKRDNVLVTRTFSKAWGLAGLRIGYGVGSAALVLEVEKARGPFKVNAVAEQAAAAAVQQDQAWLEQVVMTTRLIRQATVLRLRELGFAVSNSDANFVAVSVSNAAEAGTFLAGHGIAVRAMTAAPVVGDVLRITIGPQPMMDRLIEALAQLPR